MSTAVNTWRPLEVSPAKLGASETWRPAISYRPLCLGTTERNTQGAT
jgi:hypothetical protein